MRNNKTFGIGGKGYYIALVLCAAAIGIAGYVYRNNHNKVQQVSVLETQEVRQEEAPTAATAGLPTESQPAATQPRQTTPQGPVETAPQRTLKTAAPVQGVETASYSMDALSYNETTRDWRVHNGVDYTAEEGTPVSAAADGVVASLQEDDLMGATVVLRHTGGYETTYAGLRESPELKAGDSVVLGQRIGVVGTTALAETALGPHVHFSVTYQDMPMDPEDFLSLG